MLSALRSEKADKIIEPVTMAVMALFFLVFVVTLWWYSLKAKVICAMAALAILLLLLALVRGQIQKRPVYVLGFVFVLWFIATRFIIGDTKLSQTLYLAAEIIFTYTFIFPFAAMVNQKRRLAFFDGLSLAFVVLNIFFAIIGIYAFLSGKTLLFPGNLSTGIVSRRLRFFGLNENVCGLFMVFSMAFTVYLLLRARRRLLVIPGAILLLLFYCVLVLTDCRLAKIALLVILFPITAIVVDALWHRPRNKKIKLAATVGIAIAAIMLCYVGYGAASDVFSAIALRQRENSTVSEAYVEQSEETAEDAGEADDTNIPQGRELVDGYYSGRLLIYTCFWEYIKDHPLVLFTGAANFSIRTMTSYHSIDPSYYMTLHLHSSFLQTLALTGIPGLLLVLAICVFLLIYSLRVLFCSGCCAAEKIIPTFLLLMIVEAVGESMIFVPFDIMSNVFMDALFFLCGGYTVEMGRERSRKRSINERTE